MQSGFRTRNAETAGGQWKHCPSEVEVGRGSGARRLDALRHRAFAFCAVVGLLIVPVLACAGDDNIIDTYLAERRAAAGLPPVISLSESTVRMPTPPPMAVPGEGRVMRLREFPTSFLPCNCRAWD